MNREPFVIVISLIVALALIIYFIVLLIKGMY